MAESEFGNNSPVQFSELDSEFGKTWNNTINQVMYGDGFVRVGKVGGVFPRNFLKFYETMRDFPVFADDIWVLSYPKSGTTWTQEMVWCIANDLDFEGAKVDLPDRFPYFEFTANLSPNARKVLIQTILDNTESQNGEQITMEYANQMLNSFDKLKNLERPRFVKCHLHRSLLPIGLKSEKDHPKIIYVVRHPKDACLSFYHHSCILDGYQGTLEDFVNCFISDNAFFSPYWTHVREYWEMRDRKNVLFLKYEDMKKDLPAVIKKTADFLGKSLTEDQVDRLENHLSFESMQKNPAVNYEQLADMLCKVHGVTHPTKFLRKGKVGSWKEEMTPEMISKFDAWIAQNKIEGLYEY